MGVVFIAANRRQATLSRSEGFAVQLAVWHMRTSAEIPPAFREMCTGLMAQPKRRDSSLLRLYLGLSALFASPGSARSVQRQSTGNDFLSFLIALRSASVKGSGWSEVVVEAFHVQGHRGPSPQESVCTQGQPWALEWRNAQQLGLWLVLGRSNRSRGRLASWRLAGGAGTSKLEGVLNPIVATIRTASPAPDCLNRFALISCLKSRSHRLGLSVLGRLCGNLRVYSVFIWRKPVSGSAVVVHVGLVRIESADG